MLTVSDETIRVRNEEIHIKAEIRRKEAALETLKLRLEHILNLKGEAII